MKKLFFIVCMAVVLCGVAVQNANAQFGIKGGVYTTHFSKMEDFKIKNNAGFQAGVLYKFHLLPSIYVQPELLYVEKNAKYESKGSSTPSESERLNLQYIQLPVSFQYGFNLILFRPFFQIAPYINYNISQNISNDEYKWKDINRFNGGIGIGGGVDMWKFQLGIRYNWDIKKMGKDRASEDPLYKQYKLSKGRALEISLSFFL